MAALNSHFAKHAFLMFCIIANFLRVQADPKEEYDECNRQLLASFGNNSSAEGCLSYAIQHYTIDQVIPIPEKTIPAEQMDKYDQIPSDITGTQPQLIDHDQLVSRYFTDEPQFVSTEEMDYDYQIPSGFTEAQPQLIDHDQLVSRYFTDEPQFVSTQNEDVTNYADRYHKALENMVHGSGIPNRDRYCIEHFEKKGEYGPCFLALDHFGNTGVSAVEKAFKYYTLEGCEKKKKTDPKYVYIHAYVQELSGICTTKPSTRPELFCEQQTSYKPRKHKNKKKSK